MVKTSPVLAAEFLSLQQRSLSVGGLAKYFANQGLSEVPKAKLTADCIKFISAPDEGMDCSALENRLGTLAQRAQINELDKATYFIVACVNGGLVSEDSAYGLYQKVSATDAHLHKQQVYARRYLSAYIQLPTIKRRGHSLRLR